MSDGRVRQVVGTQALRARIHIPAELVMVTESGGTVMGASDGLFFSCLCVAQPLLKTSSSGNARMKIIFMRIAKNLMTVRHEVNSVNPFQVLALV